jgi:hypothetical protein
MRSRSLLKFACILAFILVPVLVSYSAVNPANAVGVWLFNEGAGAVAKDSSGNGNDGTIALATWADGKFGKALSFDGTASVTVASTAALNNGGQYTLMGYFYATALDNPHQVIAKDGQYLMRIDTPGEGGKMSSFVNLGGAWEPRASAIVPEINKWYHYAAVYDSGTKKLTVFVDGVKAGESDRDGAATANDNAVTFGCWGGGSFFKGLLDEIAIFNVALSEADISTIAKSGLAAILNLASVAPSGKLATTWGSLK